MGSVFVAIAVTAGIASFGCMIGVVVSDRKALGFLVGSAVLGVVAGLASNQALKIDNAPAQPPQAVVQQVLTPLNG